MEIVILIVCSVIGTAAYYGLIKPFCTSLTSRIPTGKEYRATLGAKHYR